MSLVKVDYGDVGGGFNDFTMFTDANSGTSTISCEVGDVFAMLFMTASGSGLPYTAMDGVTCTGADMEVVDHFNGTRVTQWGGINIAGTWYKVVATDTTIVLSTGVWNYIKLTET